MFGDRNDPNSDVSKALLDPRNYNLLEELHTLPGVSYMTKVRNQESQPTEEKA
jgi:molybdopterin-containing oxidoreductase family iron-sulfur binding subunit